MLVEILLAVSVLINITIALTFYIFIRKTENKIEIYETFISGIFDNLHRAHDVMKASDIRGAFESDDEVGEVFRIIKFEIDRLKNIIDSGVDSETQKK